MYAILMDFWGTMFYPEIPIREYLSKRAEYLWKALNRHGYVLSLDYVYNKLVESRRLADRIRNFSLLEVTVVGEVLILLDKLGINARDDLVRELSRAFIRPYYAFTKPARDVGYFLNWVSEMGWPLGLVSNTMYGKATKKLLTKYGLRKYFKVLALSDEIGFRKPHPKIFMYVLKSLRLKRENIIMIGDEICDIYGAKNLGLKAIQYTGFRDEKIRFADFKAKSYREIIEYIRKEFL